MRVVKMEDVVVEDEVGFENRTWKAGQAEVWPQALKSYLCEHGGQLVRVILAASGKKLAQV